MPGAAEVRRRERRRRDAEAMTVAAGRVRERVPAGYAGLDAESGEAVAALLEEIAAQARNPDILDRIWQQAARTADRVNMDDTPTRPTPPFGPAPTGHTGPALDRTDRPFSKPDYSGSQGATPGRLREPGDAPVGGPRGGPLNVRKPERHPHHEGGTDAARRQREETFPR